MRRFFVQEVSAMENKKLNAVFTLALLFAACGNKGDTGNEIVLTREEAIDVASRVSGPSTSVCNIPYDSDADGINDSTLFAIGQDSDGDGLAVIPINLADIFANGQYGCVDNVLNGFVLVVDATIGLDCSDTDSAVTTATTPTYIDSDSDGYGQTSSLTWSCGIATGWSAVGGDCDDTATAINPAATEVCDTVDNDCDGSIDEGVTITYYADVDGDGYGDDLSTTQSCSTVPTGYLPFGGDCDDGASQTFPGAATLDSTIDCMKDSDFDNYGDETITGTVIAGTDCDDGVTAVNPGAIEVIGDAVDNDCDAATLDTTTTTTDVDGDGYPAATDCDDGDATVNPGEVEVSLDGIDNNCDGLANTSDSVAVCVEPESGLSTFPWKLLLRDWTVFPDGNDDPNWNIGYASGVGTLCASFVLMHGNVLAINGPWDIDGDGVYGDDNVWLYQDVTHVTTMTLDGYSIVPTSYSWGGGYDGHWTINLL